MSTGTETISGRPARLGTSRLGSSLRLAATLATTLLGLLFVTFIIGRVMPIDPVLAVIGERATQAQYDEVFRDLGLDKPLLVQFVIYVRDVVTFDFGTSIRTGKPVAEDLTRVFPATFELATIGTLIGVVLGVPMGVAAAVFRGRWIDQVVRVIGLIGYSIPVFWLGLVGLLIFYGVLGWVAGPGRLGVFYQGLVPERTGLILIDSVIVGDWTVFRDAFSHIILPASILAYYSLAYISRMTRSFMLEQLNSEYITTARVKGLSDWQVVWGHAFRNIRVQLVTVIALAYANLLEGSVLTEIIFAWPGLGSYITTSLLANDMASVLGGTVLIGAIFVALNIFSDLLYRVFDPRAK